MLPYEIIQYILKIKTINWLNTIPECKICEITYTDGSYYQLLLSIQICNLCYDKMWTCFGCNNLTEQCNIDFCGVCELPWCDNCISTCDCMRKICVFCEAASDTCEYCFY